MKLFSYKIWIAILLFLTSCDCWNSGEGTVYDFDTNMPLDSVKVVVYADDELWKEMYTDTTGFFFCQTGNTGFCRDLKFVLSRDGYKGETVINPDSAVVLMKKE